jgi:hypothetical protein
MALTVVACAVVAKASVHHSRAAFDTTVEYATHGTRS